MAAFLWSLGGTRACAALAFAGLSMTYFSGQDMWVAYSERRPTHINLADWNNDYHDEHWLSVNGKVSIKSPVYQRKSNGETLCYVPVISPDEGPAQHIHVVARISGKTREEVDSAVVALAYSSQPIEGVISTHGDPILPIDHLAADVVVLKAGVVPGIASDYGFLAFIGAGMSLFFGYFALRSVFRFFHKAHVNHIERAAVVTAAVPQPTESRPFF